MTHWIPDRQLHFEMNLCHNSEVPDVLSLVEWRGFFYTGKEQFALLCPVYFQHVQRDIYILLPGSRVN